MKQVRRRLQSVGGDSCKPCLLPVAALTLPPSLPCCRRVCAPAVQRVCLVQHSRVL